MVIAGVDVDVEVIADVGVGVGAGVETRGTRTSGLQLPSLVVW